ncbi:MAG: hypothetical protein IJU95_05740, partial [Treponema sp.]|nr:hypothetical protein [Treponema sp.]
MRKILRRLMFVLLAGMSLSCASAKAKGRQAKATEPEYSIDSANKMDENWGLYYSTGDETYLENIIAYADTEDLLAKKINAKYKKLSSDERLMGILRDFGGEEKNRGIEFPYDFELLAGFLLYDEGMADDIKYVYSFFPQELLIRGVMKGTAFWSLTSNAEQYENINIALQKHIPYMNEKSRVNFCWYMKLDKEIGLVKSDKGTATFQRDDIWIAVTLVNDMNAAVCQWESLAVNENPMIRSSVRVDAKNNSIGPFIAFRCGEQAEYQLYYDCELITPGGKLSPNKGSKLLFAESRPENCELIYSVPQNYVMVFDDSDAGGNYTV